MNHQPTREGLRIMNDHERDAWDLEQAGLTWTQIAREIGCTEGAAEAFAAAYQHRTDAAAAENQIPLF